MCPFAPNGQGTSTATKRTRESVRVLVADLEIVVFNERFYPVGDQHIPKYAGICEYCRKII